MAGETHEVTIVNGKKKKKKKKAKKATKKKAKKKNPPAKKGTTVAKKKKKKKKGKKRKKNPSRAGRFFGGGMRVNIRDDIAYGFQRLLGKAIAAYAVGQWGDKPTANPSGGNSPTTGMKWSWKNYFIAVLAGYVGGELVGRTFRAVDGQKVYDGAVDLAMTKAFWSEIVHRIPGGAKYLGHRPMGQMPAAAPGKIYTDNDGNRWISQNGQWVAMMGHERGGGPMGQLEAATALDGDDYGDLETATALDGMDGLETQRALDGYGHLMDPDSPKSAAAQGAYMRRGSPDPFQAAYL